MPSWPSSSLSGTLLSPHHFSCPNSSTWAHICSHGMTWKVSMKTWQISQFRLEPSTEICSRNQPIHLYSPLCPGRWGQQGTGCSHKSHPRFVIPFPQRFPHTIPDFTGSLRLEKSSKILEFNHSPPYSPLNHVPKHHIHPPFEHLHWWWFPGQPVPMTDQAFSEEFFSWYLI